MAGEIEYAGKLTERVGYADKEMAKFRKKFAKTPAFALEGCDSLFELVIQRQVDIQVRTALTKHKRTIPDVVKYATEQVQKGAFYCTMSTSQTSNLSARMRTKAWATILEDIHWGCYK